MFRLQKIVNSRKAKQKNFPKIKFATLWGNALQHNRRQPPTHVRYATNHTSALCCRQDFVGLGVS